MLKFLIVAFAILALFYLGICGLLYAQQRSLMYFPTPATDSALANAVWIENEGVRIKLWHVRGTTDRAILYFGGNAEDVSRSIPALARLFPEYNLYLVNYRGYGGSGGRPAESGLKSDAVAAYDHVRKTNDRISVIARSIGSGIGMHVASKRQVHKLVLITPFDSALNVARRAFPVFPVAVMLKDRYESREYVDRLKMPVLVLLAERDGIIPPESSRALIDSIASDELSVVTVRNTTHNSIDASPAFDRALADFLQVRTAGDDK